MDVVSDGSFGNFVTPKCYVFLELFHSDPWGFFASLTILAFSLYLICVLSYFFWPLFTSGSQQEVMDYCMKVSKYSKQTVIQLHFVYKNF